MLGYNEQTLATLVAVVKSTGTFVADKSMAAWQNDWIVFLFVERVEAYNAIQREIEERRHRGCTELVDAA